MPSRASLGRAHNSGTLVGTLGALRARSLRNAERKTQKAAVSQAGACGNPRGRPQRGRKTLTAMGRVPLFASCRDIPEVGYCDPCGALWPRERGRSIGSGLRSGTSWSSQNPSSQGDMGNALGIAQFGGTAPAAKPWKGLGSGVLEVVESHDGNAYRAVYTVRFQEAVYVLHAFQKKSPSGIRTAKRDVDLVAERLRVAQKDHEEHYGKPKR